MIYRYWYWYNGDPDSCNDDVMMNSDDDHDDSGDHCHDDDARL